MARLATAIVVVALATSTGVARAQVVSAPDRQLFPRAATGGNEYMVVWDDHRAGTSWHAHGALVRTDGVVTTAGIVVSGPSSSGTLPDVAYRRTGATFLVVWAQGTVAAQDVFGQAVNDNGTPVGPVIPIATGAGDQSTPAVACEVSDCVVAYVDNASGNYHAMARVVTSGGAVGPAVNVSGTAPSPLALGPQMAVSGSTYYLAWQTEFGRADDPASGARLQNAGGTLSVLDSPAVALSAPVAEADRPSGVATDGTNMLVVWTRTGATLPAPLFGRLVSLASGLPVAPEFQIATGGDNSFHSGVVFGTSDYLVTWQDTSTNRVVTRRVNAAGGLVDPAPVVLSDSATVTDFNTAATVGFGFVLVVWDDRRDPSEDIFGHVSTISSLGFAPVAAAPAADFLISSVPAPPVPAVGALGALLLAAAMLVVGRRLLGRGAHRRP
jgi:hypothetical protein